MVAKKIPMYQRVDDNRRVTDNEASDLYPDSYILLSRGSMSGELGIVLYVADNMGDLIDLAMAKTIHFAA